MLYPWQREQWAQVVAAHDGGRLAHALLIAGPSGTGKLTFARELASRILCFAPTNDRACGACQSCSLFAARNHPDFMQIEPETEGKALLVDQIRELIDFVALRSHYRRGKCAVIHPAESMNRNAANALLKTLEEPPSESSLILVSHRPNLLPATIRSRCQRLGFRLEDQAAVGDWLRSRVGDEHDVQTLLALSGGAPLAALAMASDDSLEVRARVFEGFISLCRGAQGPVAVAERWAEFGAGRVLTLLRSIIEDLICLQATGGGAPLHNPDWQDQLQQSANLLDLKATFRAHDKLIEFNRLVGVSSGLRELDLLTDFAVLWADMVYCEEQESA